MGNTIALGKNVGTAAAPALAAEFAALRGTDVSVNASKTNHIGALGLQVIVAACRQWKHDGHGFSLSAFSDAFRHDARTLGIALTDLGANEAGSGGVS